MFQDEITIRMEQSRIHYFIGNLRQPFQGVRRVGKNEVETLFAEGQEVKYIVMHHRYNLADS